MLKSRRLNSDSISQVRPECVVLADDDADVTESRVEALHSTSLIDALREINHTEYQEDPQQLSKPKENNSSSALFNLEDHHPWALGVSCKSTTEQPIQAKHESASKLVNLPWRKRRFQGMHNAKVTDLRMFFSKS